MDKLNGKIAYITGGSKGIGYGIARILMDNGLKVAISGRHKADLDKAVLSLGGDDVMGVVSDVSKPGDEWRLWSKFCSGGDRSMPLWPTRG